MTFWNGKRVLVTGGAGFIGSHLAEILVEKNASVRVADNLENGSLKNLESCENKIEFVNKDLTDQKACNEAAKDMDVVINLASKVGGVDYNVRHPGTMFTNNILINTLTLEAARLQDVDRYLCVSSACVYPRYCTIPTPESEGFREVPEPTNLGYGWAKRMAEVQAQAYSEEFGMKIAVVRPYNAYGPRDHFDPEKSHVIPAIIKRIFDGENPLVVWGDGEQTRAFVYVTDIARGMLLATEKYAKSDPLNIGTDDEIKIKDLVNIILKHSGRKDVNIFFDKTKPSGQPRRNADTSKAKRAIGYEPQVSLDEGIMKTIGWYEKNRG